MEKKSRFIPLTMLAGPAGNIAMSMLKNWKIGLFGFLVAIIIYQNFVSFELLRPVGVRTIPGIKQDIEKFESRIELCEEGRETLKTEIAETNAQIQQWVEVSEKLKDEATKLKIKLQEQKLKSDAEIEFILNSPIPKDCTGSIELLRKSATSGELKW